MNDQELLLHRLDLIEQRIESKNSNGQSWLRGLVLATVTLFIAVIFYGGMMYRDIQILKDNMIPHSDWVDNEAKTNATYNYVFKIPSEAKTRGGVPKL
jgi:hypothetical protein